MTRFLAEAEFGHGTTTELRLLPLRFERLNADRFLVANVVGDVLSVVG